jgi:hypothetical protein
MLSIVLNWSGSQDDDKRAISVDVLYALDVGVAEQ